MSPLRTKALDKSLRKCLTADLRRRTQILVLMPFGHVFGQSGPKTIFVHLRFKLLREYLWTLIDTDIETNFLARMAR